MIIGFELIIKYSYNYSAKRTRGLTAQSEIACRPTSRTNLFNLFFDL